MYTNQFYLYFIGIPFYFIFIYKIIISTSNKNRNIAHFKNNCVLRFVPCLSLSYVLSYVCPCTTFVPVLRLPHLCPVLRVSVLRLSQYRQDTLLNLKIGTQKNNVNLLDIKSTNINTTRNYCFPEIISKFALSIK